MKATSPDASNKQCCDINKRNRMTMPKILKFSPKTNTKMKKGCRSCWNGFLLVLGVALMSLGLYIFIYFEGLYEYFLTRAMTFEIGTESYKAWSTNDPPLDLDIYLFNWTNPEDLLKEGVKPKFQEVGPYRFKEIKEKMNITWHRHNNTISYKHRKLYYFDTENSPKNLSDVVNMINIVPLAAAYKSRYYGGFMKGGLSYFLSKLTNIYVTKTVGEILFEGYYDSVLGIASLVPLSGHMSKFGLFYGRNNTIGGDGEFSMWTKVDENFGRILTWNHRNFSGYYDGPCGSVHGSAGEFFPLNRKRDYVEFFSSELCKFAKMNYEKDVMVKGVKGYKYTGRNIFDNGSMHQENTCFCPGDCYPSGIFNVSKCRGNVPAFLSMPHFYGADPYYINAVEGMNPKEHHELYITLEPKSGIVIDIGVKIQLNMLLQPIKGIKMYEDVPRVFMPIFYFDQNLPASDELATLLVRVQSLPEVSKIGVLVLEMLGVGAFTWLILNIYYSSRGEKKKKDQNVVVTLDEMPLRC